MSARPSDSGAPCPSQPDELRAGRVLVADDSHDMRELLSELLRNNQFEPVVANDGAEAYELVTSEAFDVVLSDIRMPKMDGVALLEAIKKHEPDLPVVLLTGAPDLASAIRAVELGAFRYLTKPFVLAEVIDVVVRAHQLSRLARARREAASLALHEREDSDRQRIRARLDDALDSLTMAYQPLVDVHKKSVLGYEALLRSSSTVLRGALEVIDAAERLDSLPQLGRRIRRAVVTTIGGAQLNGWSIFVNVHPLELSDDELLDPASPLAAHARQVVLEVTERFALDRVDRLAERVEHLRRLGYRLAIDDLGAGYASLNSFAQLQPDFVKLDMALVHHAPGDSMRRRLIRSMVQVCDELGIQVVAEGVETVEQRDTLMRLGCRVMQGYLFARPAPSFPLVSW